MLKIEKEGEVGEKDGVPGNCHTICRRKYSRAEKLRIRIRSRSRILDISVLFYFEMTESN